MIINSLRAAALLTAIAALTACGTTPKADAGAKPAAAEAETACSALKVPTTPVEKENAKITLVGKPCETGGAKKNYVAVGVSAVNAGTKKALLRITVRYTWTKKYSTTPGSFETTAFMQGIAPGATGTHDLSGTHVLDLKPGTPVEATVVKVERTDEQPLATDAPTDSGTTGSKGDSNSTGTVTPGAYCDRAGATGRTSKGTRMTCKTASDGRLRWKS
ncbi:hypothetical protein ACIPRL_34970 [Streptomyces sp. NPDC090085]|uniref:hypothetical protein n=1 Tax=Streptomyces sp. NPDC090085 TaxID=3365943 RepID=UPI0037FA83B2